MRAIQGEGWMEVHPLPDEEVDFSEWDLPIPDPPAVPRRAATVMLLRDAQPNTRCRITDGDMPVDFPTDQNIEVFMLRRAKSMDFVPDAVVFPGGRVDERDANPGLPWAGPTPGEWAVALGLDEMDARMLVVAAARELFEECGVLLAGPDENTVSTDLSGPDWQDAREALAKHELSFAEFMIDMDLVLRSDLLGLVSNLCTPPHLPKRFDTYFFAALLPEGQTPDDKTSEAQVADWVTPAYAIREGDAKRWRVMGPQVYNLTQLAEANSAKEFVESHQTVADKMMFHLVRPESPDEKPYLRWER